MPRSWFDVTYLQGSDAGGATANGNGVQYEAAGSLGAQQVEIRETAGGTASITFEGSFDATNWYAAGYQQVDAVAAPTRAVAAIAVTANAKHVYQVLDPYPWFRARMSAVAGGGTIVAKLYAVGS